MSLKLVHRGSVKDIYEKNEVEFVFRFSDRYSIFDWGKMPDEIPGKGTALALMGEKIFTHLSAEGVKTHFLGKTEDPRELRVQAVTVPRDGIEVYQTKPTSILIPLEVIYRFGVPKGSSLLKKNLGYQEGEQFKEVKLDFTTKLERMDRVLTEGEAKKLSGMSESEWHSLFSLTKKIANNLKKIFSDCELMLWDGKLEFAFDENRNIMLVDSIGLDEMRLTYHEQSLSKEILRQAYLDSTWFQALCLSKTRDPAKFKEYCVEKLKETPQNLSPEIVTAVGDLYQVVSKLVLNQDQTLKETLLVKLKKSLVILTGKK